MLLPFLILRKRAYVWLEEYFGGLWFSSGIEFGKMIFTPSNVCLWPMTYLMLFWSCKCEFSETSVVSTPVLASIEMKRPPVYNSLSLQWKFYHPLGILLLLIPWWLQIFELRGLPSGPLLQRYISSSRHIWGMCQSWEFPPALMGVLAPGSAHARPSARPLFDTSGNFPEHVSAESP